MAWLRIDDGFTKHPKFEGWPPAARWAWLETMEYCARYRTGGRIPADLSLLPKAVTATLLERAERANWCSRGEDGALWIHDWSHYNPKDPSAAERMQQHRSTTPTTDSGRWKQTRARVFERDDGICIDCGKDCKRPGDHRDIWNADHEPPREELVAAGEDIYDIAHIVTRCHSCHSKKTRYQAAERRANKQRTMSERETEQRPNENVTSRAGTARGPVPSRPKRELKAEQFSLPDDAALPATQDLEDEDLPDRSDPVIRLLLALNDRDDRTEAVLRSIAGQVSEAAFDYTRDEIQRTGGGAGKAVAILKRIAEEGTLASPGEETPAPAPVTTNGSSFGPAYIAGLIRNGVLTDRADLETELDLAGVEDADRSSLVAQLQLAQQLEGRE